MSGAKQPPAGILKNKASFATPPAKSLSSAHGPGEVTWDEEGITEHDLTRGSRMRIDEPNTPFYHSTSLGTEEMEECLADSTAANLPPPPPQGGVDMVALSSRLAALQDPRKNIDDSDDSEEEEEEEEEEEAKKRRFAEARRKHYDEFIRVKKLSGSLEEEADEEEED